ncbi:hypothetical protein ACLI1R_000656 [Corynebacterium sp. LaCa97]|jgi:hypothetical protein|nr:MAG TPA: hypothetical protein [Caudoviricetes sp.]
MNISGIQAFMLGYIEATLKERIDPKDVDELFAEAETVARERLNQPKTQ